MIWRHMIGGVALLALTLCMSCADDLPEDSARLAELSDDEWVAACDDLCDNATNYTLTCESEGGTVEYSGSWGNDCATACPALKNLQDNCPVTFGQLRALSQEPADCAEAEENTTTALALVACSGLL